MTKSKWFSRLTARGTGIIAGTGRLLVWLTAAALILTGCSRESAEAVSAKAPAHT